MKNICDKEKCTGCGLCAYLCAQECIRMSMNDEGFFYPEIDYDKCINCGKCQGCCPANNPADKTESKELFAAYSKNDKIRRGSSSGGVATEMAINFVKAGGVIAGARFSDCKKVEHVVTDNPNIIQKSKYVQSDLSQVYKSIENVIHEKKVLFFGTPCQIAAVKRAFSDKKSAENLFTCELLCHAAPSPGIFTDYIKHLESKNGHIASYDFRSKSNGWNRASVEIKYDSGKRYCKLHRYDVFHNWFGKYLTVRNSCFNCPYRTNMRVGDITIGDFWGIEKELPEIDVKYGVSRILINTEKGNEMAHSLFDNLSLIPISIGRVQKNYSKLFGLNVDKPDERDVFMKIYKEKGISELINRYPATGKLQYFIRRLKKKLFR